MRREKYFLDAERAESRGIQYLEQKAENRKQRFSSGTTFMLLVMSCVDICNDLAKIRGGTRFYSSISDFLMSGTDKSRRIWPVGGNFVL
jgi:hypothetical protein